MKRKFVCAMHLAPTERKKVITLGNKVAGKLDLNSATFPAPPTSPADLAAQVEILEKLDAAAKKGGEDDTHLADAQSISVYDLLFGETPYVNKIANYDRTIIDKSGFDSSLEPVAKQVCGKPVINRIEDGKEPHSAKIFLAKFEPGAMHIIEIQVAIPIGDTTGFSEWKVVHQTTNSRQLIISGLKRAVEINVRVSDQNSAGTGDPSEPMSFLPR